MATIGKHGVTASTPENILLGAGAFYKGLKYEKGEMYGNWSGTCIGATSGGGKVSIEGEYLDIELDGALVLVKGLTVKLGGKASMEVSIAEMSSDTIKMATNFANAEDDGYEDAAIEDGYSLYVDKPNINEGDYIENFGFVGVTANGKKDIAIIFEYALCKSAFELEGKNKENTVLKVVLDAYAENAGDLNTLPVKIYYPDEPIDREGI